MRRILTVILASDVAGYSRLVADHEEQTVFRFREASAVLADLVKKYQGVIFNTAGDATLARFDSAVDAVRCAIDFQDVNNANNSQVADGERLLFRIGIAIGDVLVSDNGDLLGDAVNVAARLENIAEPGGICISDDVRAHVLNKIRLSVVDLGDQALKNIPRAVRVFKLVPQLEAARGHLRSFGKTFAVGGLAAGLLAVVAGLLVWAVVAWYPNLTTRPSGSAGPTWTVWHDHAGYQQEFDRQVRNRWYPRMIEAQLIEGVVKYRAFFEPYPSTGFAFYARHSINDEEFGAADIEYTKRGFRRIYQQRIVVGTRPFNQATWTKP